MTALEMWQRFEGLSDEQVTAVERERRALFALMETVSPTDAQINEYTAADAALLQLGITSQQLSEYCRLTHGVHQ
jgi:hypothetical protein